MERILTVVAKLVYYRPLMTRPTRRKYDELRVRWIESGKIDYTRREKRYLRGLYERVLSRKPHVHELWTLEQVCRFLWAAKLMGTRLVDPACLERCYDAKRDRLHEEANITCGDAYNLRRGWSRLYAGPMLATRKRKRRAVSDE